MKMGGRSRLARTGAALLALGIICTAAGTALAEDIPYAGYTYDEWNEPIPSKTGYLPDEVVYGDRDHTVQLNAPEDMCVAEDSTLYVLDSGNNRVVVLSPAFALIRVIETFTLPDGGSYTLQNPTGIAVRDGKMWIADYDNQTVVAADTEGHIYRLIRKPESATFPQESAFHPQKVLCDSRGNLYVSVLGVYQGAAVFDKDGEFSDFFGSNSVQVTLSLLMDRFWKSLMNEDQQEQISNYVPVQFTGFDLSARDFLYTCTGANDGNGSRLSRINPNGGNLWSGISAAGDKKVGYYKIHSYPTSFVDVAVTEEEFLFALDATKGRIFLYDTEGSPVFVFGGKGTQKGTFAIPAAIDTDKDSVLVLDKARASITRFRPTDFGKTVKEALIRYYDGDYDGSRTLWEQVLTQDGNLFTAYVGIGKALFYSGEYKEAMHYFRKGCDRENESRAFGEYRAECLRAAFPALISGLCGLVLLCVVFGLIRRRRRRSTDA